MIIKTLSKRKMVKKQMPKNSDYWKERIEELEEEQYQKSLEYFEDIKEQFKKAQMSIQSDIEKWYYRLAENNGISYSQAKKFLKKAELGEFSWTLEQYIQKGKENGVSGEWIKELENASAKYHISYLEAMKLQIQQYAEILYSEYEKGVTDFLEESFKNQFYKTAFEIAKGTGVGTNLAIIDTRKIDAILKKPWAQDGKMFSDRIWQNKEKLVRELHAELTQCIIRGASPQKAISNLAKKMNVSKSQAGNLIMTESAAISAMARKGCFDELGVARYRIIAALDGRTCDVCGALDGKIFKVSEYEIGVTAHPFHPRCRCDEAPYYDEGEELGINRKRVARDPVTGKEYKVPADMTYEEWYDKFIKDNPEEILAIKKMRNETADKNQFADYKSVLGKDIPGTLDSFQEIKYTDDERWRYIKLDYSRRNKLINNPELALPGADKAIVPNEKFTKYLFGGNNIDGLPKGENFKNRLGYSVDNWKMLQEEIRNRASLYPVVSKGDTGFGERFEQKIVLNGLNEKPANVVVGWIHKPDGTTAMTSAYIKEV